MDITFLGAVREVTGSMHVLSVNSDRIMLDCGMFQGRRKESAEKNRILSVDPTKITNVVLSHAHIDHSGRIPVLTKNGFSGRIVCNRATADACEYLLLDAAHIQESDAAYLNYKAIRSHLSRMKNTGSGRKGGKGDKDARDILKKNRHQIDVEAIAGLFKKYRLDPVEALYSTPDAEDALTYFDGIPYRHPVNIGENVICTQYDAGHILGSAISMIRAQENGRAYTVCYSGDIGRFDKPIIQDPETDFEPEDRNVDLMIMESTYGNRLHEPVQDLKPGLKKVLTETYERGGSVLIPSFAFGRTQELLYTLHELYDEGDIQKVPIYVDSPLATKITKVFGEHPETYDDETHDTFLERGRNPFSMDQIHFVSSVEESMALNRDESPHIVISASGMCEAGRILHHLRYKIHNSKHTVLIVGYMAAHTLGRRMLEQGTAYEASGRSGTSPILKILGKEYPLNAHVVKLGGFSAHADKNEMVRFLEKANLKVKRIALVHGEEEQTLAFAEDLRAKGYDVAVPEPGETIKVS
ncbi:MAG: MBL fold metallo-hydrolase [Thermodesulfobacteriota bacterium]